MYKESCKNEQTSVVPKSQDQVTCQAYEQKPFRSRQKNFRATDAKFLIGPLITISEKLSLETENTRIVIRVLLVLQVIGSQICH